MNSVCPGLTATDMTGHNGQPVETGAEIVVKMALLGADGPSCTFVDRNGPVAW